MEADEKYTVIPIDWMPWQEAVKVAHRAIKKFWPNFVFVETNDGLFTRAYYENNEAQTKWLNDDKDQFKLIQVIATDKCITIDHGGNKHTANEIKNEIDLLLLVNDLD